MMVGGVDFEENKVDGIMDNYKTAQDKMVSRADKEENLVDEMDDGTSATKENHRLFGALLQGEDVGKKALNINELPEELLLEIFLHLPPQTALKVLFFFWTETKILLRQLLAKKVFIIMIFSH